jgi:NTP pyrophosphatase (non-canonical NTP hydrolase)
VTQLDDLTRRIARFADERDWEQFHSPKNLTMALTVEAAELQEHFQWLTGEQSRDLPAEKRSAVEAEMGDVFIYLLRLADQLGVDLVGAAEQKMETNARNYPVDLARGNATKHTDLDR